APRIDRVNLKHPFRQIETNPRDSRQIPDRLAHGRLPFRWVDDNDHLGTLMPFGAPSTPSLIDGLANGSNRPEPAVAKRATRKSVGAIGAIGCPVWHRLRTRSPPIEIDIGRYFLQTRL